MSSAVVRTAFRTELAAAFPAVPIYDTLSLRIDNPSLPALWMSTDFIPTNDVPISIGTPSCRRESGLFRTYIVAKAGAGDAAAIAQADAVISHFRRWADSTGQIRVAGNTPPTPQDQSDGRWLIVSIDFSFNNSYYI